MPNIAVLLVTLAAAATAGTGAWRSLGPPGVAAARLAASPDGTSVAFTDGAGVWVSRNGGVSWEEGPLPSTEVLHLLFEPTHPGDLVALVRGWPGLGEREAVVTGARGGREWSLRWVLPEGASVRLAVPDPWIPGALILSGTVGTYGVHRLHPDGRIELLLELEDGVADLAPVPGRALWVLPATHAPRRSTDGGRSWTVVADPSRGPQYAIAASPFDPDTVAVGDDAAISTSTDGGGSWTSRAVGAPVRRLAFSPADPDQLWAAGPTALLRSTDRGLRWTRMPLRDGSYADVAPDPADPSGVWVAAPTPPRGIAWPGVLRSDDRGRTFRLATEGLAALPVEAVLPSPDGSPPQPVVRTRSVDFGLDAGAWNEVQLAPGVRADTLARDPSRPERLYATAFVTDPDTYGDTLFVSDDGGRSWRRTAPPVPREWFYELAPDPYDPDVVLAAGRFGVVAFHPESGGWSGGLGDDASADTVAFLPDRPGVALAAGAEWGAVYRSTDHGATWERVATPGLPPWGRWRLVPAAGDRVYLHSPVDGGTLLASDDAGATWRPVRLPAPGCGPPAPAPGSPDDLVVACARERRGWGLHRSTDGGRSWRAIPGPPGLAASTVARDPADPAALWVGTARHGVWWGRVPPAARRPRGRLPRPLGATTGGPSPEVLRQRLDAVAESAGSGSGSFEPARQ